MLTRVTITTIHGRPLMTGYYSSHADCLGDVAARGISLAGADLAGLDLRAAELDEVDLRDARLFGTNLAGANISESDLRGCDFTHANLADTCLAYSDLRNARLLHCRIGATDISGAQLDNCLLAGPESFALPFASCASMMNCVFCDEDRATYTLNRPPVVIAGFSERIIIMDQGIKQGSKPVRPHTNRHRV